MLKTVPVVILCGGKGIFVHGLDGPISKALVPVLGKPMVFHVMTHYMSSGAKRFVLCLGYQAEELRTQILSLASSIVQRSSNHYDLVFGAYHVDVLFQDTGVASSTGERVQQILPIINDASHFALTYSDTISDLDISQAYTFFLKTGLLGSLAAVYYPVRFRVLGLNPFEPIIQGFSRKPVIQNEYINGGYYFFKIEVQDLFLNAPESLILEEHILEQLVEDKQLGALCYKGQWQSLDSERDIAAVTAIIQKGR
jgi:glucose-1-phosphate cytidylyltransferase